MMADQILRICFFVLFSISLIQISCSESNQTISKPPKTDQPSTSSPEHTQGSIPEAVEEPDFFSPERYPVPSPPPVSEPALDTQIATNDYNDSLDRAAVYEPDDRINVSLNRTPAQEPSQEFGLSETETVSSVPEVQVEGDDHKDQVKALEPAALHEMLSPEANKSSAEPEPEPEADDDYEPTKTSVAPAPSTANPSTEIETETTQIARSSMSPAPCNMPSETENSHTLSLLPEQSTTDYNSTEENLETVTSEDSAISLLDRDNSTPVLVPSSSEQETEESTDQTVDEDVDMPPMSPNPVMQSTYTAEEEAGDIKYEENESGDNNGVKVARFMVGVCLIGLAGLLCKCEKKKKTRFQYQSLSKGI